MSTASDAASNWFMPTIVTLTDMRKSNFAAIAGPRFWLEGTRSPDDGPQRAPS